MSKSYILGVDQSTQSTKSIIIDQNGNVISRHMIPHEQLVSKEGYVSHNLEDIFQNTLKACQTVITGSGIDVNAICGLALTNQRETTAAWDRSTGRPLANAVVWHCNRASAICLKIEEIYKCRNEIYEKTGLPLSPYYPASKMTWLLQNEPAVSSACANKSLALGTIDSYLIFRLTNGKNFNTDYSNAARTQLFDIQNLKWDPNICSYFKIPMEALPEVIDSDGNFGVTDLNGFLANPIPILSVLGDSNGALFGHHCINTGDSKVTFGTGSSIMLNIGDTFIHSTHNLSTSLAWRIHGKSSYVLEGNITHTGNVISWLKDSVKLVSSPQETEELAISANKNDKTYLIPAFTGLGAPWCNPDAKAILYGMSLHTGRNEIVKACCDSIAYQVYDVINAMSQDLAFPIRSIYGDGGPTKNNYLMQMQADIANTTVKVSKNEDQSIIGTIFLAGLSIGLWDESIFNKNTYRIYTPIMNNDERIAKIDGWYEAVRKIM